MSTTSKTAERRQRAAEYFGAVRHPRVSVNVGNDSVLLAWRVGNQPLLAIYREHVNGRESGEHVRLTENRAQKIVDAVTFAMSGGG